MTFDISTDKLARLAQAVRILSAEAVEEANSGHPGMPMGTADMAVLLWASVLRFDPAHPEWVGRDRFVLSAGHGSALLYSLLHLFQYPLPMSEVKNFRQWESKTPGHPEFGLTPGVETTTGPLGQGFANGVGMALSAKLLAQQYSTELFDQRVFGIVSDGDLMEGIASEAASLAGHLGLGNLIYLYDDNEISIGGSTDICFTEKVPERFSSYNWHVQSVDGHDFGALAAALQAAVAEPSRPSIICAATRIGFGSPNKEGTAGVHGAPLGKEELALTRKKIGWEGSESFTIPQDVQDICAEVVESRQSVYREWTERFDAWKGSEPKQAAALEQQIQRELPAQLKDELLKEFAEPLKEATRASSGRAIQVIARHVPFFIGGSADLEPSNKTLIKDSADIAPDDFSGRNIRFGVREHAMGAVTNGLAYGKNWIPYSGTFLVFADYMRPSVRLAALSHLQSLFIFTHDSFWVGEDGPTHQPIEHIESLRIIPGLHLYRPADGLETAMSYFAALERKNGPAALLFTRQGLPPIERSEKFAAEDVLRGGYVVRGEEVTERVIVATGSEVWLACAAAELLARQGLSFRVVSLPCKEAFLEQPSEYQQQVIPSSARRVSLEAGVTSGWKGFVGSDGLAIGIDHFGASAPGELLAEKFGFTPEAVAQKILDWSS